MSHGHVLIYKPNNPYAKVNIILCGRDKIGLTSSWLLLFIVFVVFSWFVLAKEQYQIQCDQTYLKMRGRLIDIIINEVLNASGLNYGVLYVTKEGTESEKRFAFTFVPIQYSIYLTPYK